MRTVLVCAVLFAASIASAQRNDAVVQQVRGIESTLRDTRYQHATRVDVAQGRYRFDCSGMVNWVMQRSAPVAFRGLGRPRPVAATYAHTIARAPTSGARRGWQRIAHYQDVRPGDVFAYESPRIAGLNRWLRLFLNESQPSGHTGIFVSSMRWRAPAVVDAEIVDSTTFPHQGDARTIGGDGGFGRGTMSFVSPDGEIRGYGWMGMMGPTIWQRVWIGRPMH